jgi:hypothetical protein
LSSFQQIASKIICSDLDSNGFQVCLQGLSTDTAARDTLGADQIDIPSLSTDGDSDSDNEDGNDDDNNDNNDDDD